jgi:exopolysaccharide production protein ExoQ
MSYKNHLHIGSVLRVRQLPWLMFLFLTAACFFSYHDLSDAKRGIDNYNLSQDDLVATVKGSLGHHIALLSLGSGAILCLARDRSNWRLRINGLTGWLFLGFVVWAFTSSIWAEDLSLTLQRLASFGILCVTALAVTRRLSLREIILWTCFTTALFLLMGIFAEVLFGTFRPFASGYRFAGSLHPNLQGINCGLLLLSAVAAAGRERRRQLLFWACALLGLIFLILSGSRTALAAAVISLVVYGAAVCFGWTKTALSLSLGMTLCVLALALAPSSLPSLKSATSLGRDDPGSVDTFTLRAVIWKDVGYYIRQRPLLGYGYDAFWTPAHISAISDEEQWGVPNGHSTYIDYLLTLGAVGMVVYIALLFAGIMRAFRLHRLLRDPGFAFCGAILVFCAIDGFLESAVIEGGLLKFLFIIVLVRLAFVPPQEDHP